MTMLDQVNAAPMPHKRMPWNEGKLTEAAAATKTRLVNPDKASD
jgi:hypothetical protein